MVDVCGVPVTSSVCDVAGDAAGALVSAPFDWLAQGMGHAAGWMFEAVWKVFDSTTMVDVTSSQYTKVYNILFGVAVFVMLGFFMLQVIGGMIRREPAALSRAALGLAKSILGSFVALTLLATALEVTDQLCIGIVNAAGTNMDQMGDRIALLTTGLVGLNLAAPGAGAILTTVLSGGLVACGGPQGADAPTDASVEDFCRTIGDLSTLDPEKLVDDLAEVGTPEGIPADAREGFEVMIDEATADEISDADQGKVNTFVAYVAETCGAFPADPE